jgi:hypothetical protein
MITIVIPQKNKKKQYLCNTNKFCMPENRKTSPLLTPLHYQCVIVSTQLDSAPSLDRGKIAKLESLNSNKN